MLTVSVVRNLVNYDVENKLLPGVGKGVAGREGVNAKNKNV